MAGLGGATTSDVRNRKMQFPQDGGLSCVRYYLATRNDGLEEFALATMESAGRHVGRLICQCGAEDYWALHRFADRPLVLLECACNGSALPVYIGEPPFEGWTVDPYPNYTGSVVDNCDCGADGRYRLAIGIGYPGDVPKLGTLDVERAQEVLIAAQCGGCDNTKIAWHLRMPEPPMIVGDEPWIRIIQGLGFGPKNRWP